MKTKKHALVFLFSFILIFSPHNILANYAGEWVGKTDSGQDVSFFVMSDSTIEDFQIFPTLAFFDVTAINKNSENWTFSFANNNGDSIWGSFNSSMNIFAGKYFMNGTQIDGWHASPIQSSLKEKIRLYLKNGFSKKSKVMNLYEYVTLPKLSENPEFKNKIYLWSAPGSGTGRSILWHGYFLPYRIEGKKFEFNVHLANGSKAAPNWIMAYLQIGKNKIFTELFQISNESLQAYKMLVETDSLISAEKGEEVQFLLSLAIGNGPIQTVWGSEFEAYLEIPGVAESSIPHSTAKNRPNNFCLNQNYPNPFNPSTTIKYELPKDTHVTLTLFNSLGQEVERLVDEHEKAGYYSITWNAVKYSTGVYFVVMEAEDFKKWLKILLVR
ncbi:T9SS type A sorting domain-containing protein [candidate division KSB1 bacterium]|nr:T9SS type A sorting domain-containing protein [candidate division KSB1 bacterium]